MNKSVCGRLISIPVFQQDWVPREIGGPTPTNAWRNPYLSEPNPLSTTNLGEYVFIFKLGVYVRAYSSLRIARQGDTWRWVTDRVLQTVYQKDGLLQCARCGASVSNDSNQRLGNQSTQDYQPVHHQGFKCFSPSSTLMNIPVWGNKLWMV